MPAAMRWRADAWPNGAALRGRRQPLTLESLEPRVLLSAIPIGADHPAYVGLDAQGNQVTVRLIGPGAGNVHLEDNGDISLIELTDATTATRLDVRVAAAEGTDGITNIGAITGVSLREVRLREVRLVGDGLNFTGSIGRVQLYSLEKGADIILGQAPPRPLQVSLVDARGLDDNPASIVVPGSAGRLRITGVTEHVSLQFAGDLNMLQLRGDVNALNVQVDGNLRQLRIQPLGGGASLNSALIAIAGDLRVLRVAGDVVDSLILAGAALDPDTGLIGGSFNPAAINNIRVDGHLIDSIISAGADPGGDGLFNADEILPGGVIHRVRIRGVVAGIASDHAHTGIYADQINNVTINRLRPRDGNLPANDTAVIGDVIVGNFEKLDTRLTVEDIEVIIARSVEQARQLGVNATIALTDREGNLLVVVRMTDPGAPPAATTVDIEAGGVGGLEAVDGIVPTSLIAATKAGTAAFLSTSGNAFTTRTAGYIIQQHFPPGVLFRVGGPLFGVQLSQLPTSDINRLPLGLSADPGGLPLYRDGVAIGGIGVEVDGLYTVDPRREGQGGATVEELIALAGQVDFQPPRQIQADRVFVEGVRLAYANARPPRAASVEPRDDYATLVTGGNLAQLLAPRVVEESIYQATMLSRTVDGRRQFIFGQTASNPLLDFIGGDGSLSFLDGEISSGEQLTAEDVNTILFQAHELNNRLRAQIRKDRPQISHVTVSVVDLDGNVLGVFRSLDAPVFGYDVSVQKARTAAFLSRPDAGDELRDLDDKVDITALQTLGYVNADVDDPFARHADAAAAIGVALDGSVAVSDRAGGFLSRPNLPDGIQSAPPGPFSALPPDAFSPFNTGLQTLLIGPKLVEFLLGFTALDEADALEAFVAGRFDAAGPFGQSSVVPLADNASALSPGGGLPGHSLANGMQIFAGSVPLYKNGVLVGAIGVSGDGIEQDDFVAFVGAAGFQMFGDGVQRADQVIVAGNLRLPYIKLPRVPFGGF